MGTPVRFIADSAGGKTMGSEIETSDTNELGITVCSHCMCLRPSLRLALRGDPSQVSTRFLTQMVSAWLGRIAGEPDSQIARCGQLDTLKIRFAKKLS